MPGIEISRTTTSGWSISTARMADGPSLTAPTTSHPGVSTAATRLSMASLSSTRRTRTMLDNVLLDGILDQLGGRLDLELFHHSVFVKRDGSGRDVQHARDLFHRSALGQELQDLALPRRQLMGGLPLVVVLQRPDQPFGDERRDVRSALHDLADRG